MRSRTLSSIAACSFVATFLACSECVQAQSYSYWWHNILTQYGRNSAICNEAGRYWNCQYVGVECKPWVQNVVWSASKGTVWLPQNSRYCDWRWEYSPDVSIVASDRWDGVPMAPGLIIQAQVRYSRWPYTSPHTMIVLSASSWYITVIEANYGAGSAYRVNRRTLSWSDFRRDVIHYTLYSVR